MKGLKTIKQNWESYEAGVVDKSACTPAMKHLAQLTYYGASLTMLTDVTRLIMDEGIDEKEVAARLDQYMEEIQEFIRNDLNALEGLH